MVSYPSGLRGRSAKPFFHRFESDRHLYYFVFAVRSCGYHKEPERDAGCLRVNRKVNTLGQDLHLLFVFFILQGEVVRWNHSAFLSGKTRLKVQSSCEAGPFSTSESILFKGPDYRFGFNAIGRFQELRSSQSSLCYRAGTNRRELTPSPADYQPISKESNMDRKFMIFIAVMLTIDTAFSILAFFN